MHESHMVEKVVKDALAKAEAQKARQITEVVLVIGEATGVDEGAVRLYWETMAEGTLLQEAALTVRMIKPQLKCPQCGSHFERPGKSFACPSCHVEGIPTDIGKEFFVENVFVVA